jgi:hypothetical protein
MTSPQRPGRADHFPQFALRYRSAPSSFVYRHKSLILALGPLDRMWPARTALIEKEACLPCGVVPVIETYAQLTRWALHTNESGFDGIEEGRARPSFVVKING